MQAEGLGVRQVGIWRCAVQGSAEDARLLLQIEGAQHIVQQTGGITLQRSLSTVGSWLL